MQKDKRIHAHSWTVLKNENVASELPQRVPEKVMRMSRNGECASRM
jgi:hypothetical protein